MVLCIRQHRLGLLKILYRNILKLRPNPYLPIVQNLW
nr:MAG TPA: hypothetical protein [Caudoviricetes sp.]DAV60251.1 MAG TPA: hypothetical protein [Caudoviricetes sp.]